MITTINTNDTLQISFIGDSQLKPICKVILRKGNFVTVQLSSTEIVKRKVHVYDNEEYIFPYGKYSMAPTAKNIN
jgi:hypothetical protein